MQDVVLVIHLILALAIIGLVMIQRSEGGGLGIGGGGGGIGGVASARGTANILTRMTAICAGLFFCTSLTLGVLASHSSPSAQSILDIAEDSAPIIQTIDPETLNEDNLKALEENTTPPPAPLAPLDE